MISLGTIFIYYTKETTFTGKYKMGKTELKMNEKIEDGKSPS